MFYGKRIKHYRERNNIKQKELVDILNIYKSLYCEYEKETKIIPLKHLNTICNYLNISIDYVFGFVENEQYKNVKVLNILNSHDIGKKIKNIRKENKLTQQEFAENLGCNASNISEYERGKYLIPTIILFKICKKYRISADYLLGKINC